MTIPWFNLGFITSLDPATKEAAHTFFGNVHTWLGYALYVVLGMHIGGALKHQIIDKDKELQRMWPDTVYFRIFAAHSTKAATDVPKNFRVASSVIAPRYQTWYAPRRS